MKKTKLKKITYAFTACLLLMALAGGVVTAANSITAGPWAPPVDPEKTTNIGQRMAQRKLNFKSQLSGVPMQGIVRQCALAQGILGKLKTKDNAARTTRTQVYTSLATRLNTIVENLGRQETDVLALVAPQKRFNDAISQYLQNAENYRTAMNDLVVMECASDPAGFKATILDARSLRIKMAENSSAIKASLPPLQKALEETKQKILTRGNNS